MITIIISSKKFANNPDQDRAEVLATEVFGLEPNDGRLIDTDALPDMERVLREKVAEELSVDADSIEIEYEPRDRNGWCVEDEDGEELDVATYLSNIDLDEQGIEWEVLDDDYQEDEVYAKLREIGEEQLEALADLEDGDEVRIVAGGFRDYVATVTAGDLRKIIATCGCITSSDVRDALPMPGYQNLVEAIGRHSRDQRYALNCNRWTATLADLEVYPYGWDEDLDALDVPALL